MAVVNSAPEATVSDGIDARTRELLEDPLFSTLLRLAAPNTLVMVTQVAVGLLEVYFIAKLGVDALAGVSLVFPMVALMVAVSQGAAGGGIATSIADALGRGDLRRAQDLAWYAIAIAVPLGLLSTVIMLAVGPRLYSAMGAEGAALDTSLMYSGTIFSGAVLLWTFNLLMSVVRGTGNLRLPVVVVCGGALLLVPLSPVLIFGALGWTGCGAIGGAIAMLIYYSAGCAVYAAYLWGHYGMLHPALRPPKLYLSTAWQILRIGGLSAVVASSTNITFAIVTGFVGRHGLEAVAGYGAGMRLELMLIPLSYGIGGPVGILVSTNLAAGKRERAVRVSWMGIAIAALGAELIGVCAAIWPAAWLENFSQDPAVVEAGSTYLRIVGPVFGFFGMGYVLYCVGQGMRQMGWPVTGALIRLMVAALGGAVALYFNASLTGNFVAVAAGMMLFGAIGFPTLLRRKEAC